MKSLIIILTLLGLTGCASGCREACVFGFGPGNAAFDAIALSYDRNDPCQTGGGDEARRKELGRPEGYQMPSFCGSGKGSRSGPVHVRGYYKSNGTYISSHTRSAPDGSKYNNLSR